MVTKRYVKTWCDWHLSHNEEVEATQRVGLIFGGDPYQADLCEDDYASRTIAEVFAVAEKLDANNPTELLPPPSETVSKPAIALAPKPATTPIPKPRKRRRDRGHQAISCPYCDRALVVGPGYASHLRAAHPQEYVKLYPDRMVVIGNVPRNTPEPPAYELARHVVPPGARVAPPA